MSSHFARLSSFDLSNLRLETPKTPFHFGGLAIAEGKPLLDASGDLRLEEITAGIERRLARIPQLRPRILFPGLFCSSCSSIWLATSRVAFAAAPRTQDLPTK